MSNMVFEYVYNHQIITIQSAEVYHMLCDSTDNE